MSIRIVKADLTWLRRYVSRWLHATLLTVAAILFTALPALAEPVPGSLPAQWNIGAEDCVASPQPPLQVHTYEPQTFILRQSPCATFEANFIYLLIGSDKALLIDTGAVADPNAMPLAKTVLELLPDKDAQKASTSGGTYSQASGSSRWRRSVRISSIGSGCAFRSGGGSRVLRFY